MLAFLTMLTFLTVLFVVVCLIALAEVLIDIRLSIKNSDWHSALIATPFALTFLGIAIFVGAILFK